jgi:hypothetical protein
MTTFEEALDMILYIRAIAASVSAKVPQHMRNYLEKLPFIIFYDEYKPALHTILAILDTYDIEIGFEALASKMIPIEIRKSWRLGAIETDAMNIALSNSIIPLAVSVIVDGAIGRVFITNRDFAEITKTALSEAVGNVFNIFGRHIIDILRYLNLEAESYPQGFPEVLTSYAVKSYLLSKIYENRGVAREELFNKILRSYILEIDEDLEKLKIVKRSTIYYRENLRMLAYIFDIF